MTLLSLNGCLCFINDYSLLVNRYSDSHTHTFDLLSLFYYEREKRTFCLWTFNECIETG